jgi:uncharacterized membrane protein YjgN (DUF898 family)
MKKTVKRTLFKARIKLLSTYMFWHWIISWLRIPDAIIGILTLGLYSPMWSHVVTAKLHDKMVATTVDAIWDMFKPDEENGNARPGDDGDIGVSI